MPNMQKKKNKKNQNTKNMDGVAQMVNTLVFFCLGKLNVNKMW